MNTRELVKFIEAVDMANLAPLVSSKHGIGKSSVMQQYAAANNLHCEVLILSLMDTGDLCGLPRTAEVGGQLSTVWAAPAWFNRIVNAAWPTQLSVDALSFADSEFRSYVTSRHSDTISRETLNQLYCDFYRQDHSMLHLHVQSSVTYKYSQRSILFVDEANRAATDVLNASLQLILDRRLNDHRLPIINGKPTLVAAAINPADADYTVNTFDPALLDRFVFSTLDPDTKVWLDDFARPNDLAPVVRDFLAEHPDRIHYTPADNGVGATPRSWAALATVMSNIDRVAPEVQFQVMKGCIGHELASQFLSYYNNYAKVIKVEDIEKLIATKSKRTTDVEKLGEHVNKLIENQEAMQKTELAENMFTKYIGAKDANAALPLIAFLYGLDLEILNGFLKSKKETDEANYKHLAAFDGTLNNKGLFRKVTTRIKA